MAVGTVLGPDGLAGLSDAHPWLDYFTFSRHEGVDVLAEFANVPLLVIDEIGMQYGTESEQNHLFDVLDRRYRDMMPTILLTNQNKDGFRQYVGDRIYDRMTECARWVPFAWDSYRPTARREICE